MRAIKIVLAVFIFIMLSGTVLAATLHGSIYDIELNELNDVVVEVDSSPSQRYVSKDGMYSFDLNPGEYTLTAKYSQGFYDLVTSEKVSITAEGDFVFDLFLFPGLDSDDTEYLSEDDVFDVTDNVVDESGSMSGLTIAIIAVVGIILLLILYYFVGRFKHRVEKEEIADVEKLEEKARAERNASDNSEHHTAKHHDVHEKLDDEDLQKVVDVIKSEGGRTTQKELRKQIPLSEAKISLMVSELEHKKIVSKVKKGRGNIIILKKK